MTKKYADGPGVPKSAWGECTLLPKGRHQSNGKSDMWEEGRMGERKPAAYLHGGLKKPPSSDLENGSTGLHDFKFPSGLPGQDREHNG